MAICRRRYPNSPQRHKKHSTTQEDGKLNHRILVQQKPISSGDNKWTGVLYINMGNFYKLWTEKSFRRIHCEQSHRYSFYVMFSCATMILLSLRYTDQSLRTCIDVENMMGMPKGNGVGRIDCFKFNFWSWEMDTLAFVTLFSPYFYMSEMFPSRFFQNQKKEAALS